MDLFGNAPPDGSTTLPRSPLVLSPPIPRGKHYVEPRGYAAMPGTGPEGKRCRDCAHYAHAGGVAGSYPKCGLNRARWTHGRATDILANAPSCKKFTEREAG
jgi:hypothetical protein